MMDNVASVTGVSLHLDCSFVQRSLSFYKKLVFLFYNYIIL